MSGGVSLPTFLPGALSAFGRGCRAVAERNPAGGSAVVASSQVTNNRTKSSSRAHVNRPFPVISAKSGNNRTPTLVPDHIAVPDYAATQEGSKAEQSSAVETSTSADSTLFNHQKATLWTGEEIEYIRNSCQVAKRALQIAESMVKPGTTSKQIDDELHNEIIRSHAYPSILRFQGYPRSTSISVNNVINGIPDDRPLQDGDIVTVDVACYLDGFHGGCARTFKVGTGVDAEGHHLVSAALECLHAGVAACGPKVPFSHIAADILRLASRRRVGVVKALAGHGIGREFQCPPDIYHGYNSHPGAMKPGQVFTVEPCLTEGAPLVKKMSAECPFTLTTTDNWRSAQFQHTVAVTNYGVDILSL